MQLPSMLILVILVVGSFYVKLAKIDVQGKVISWATPVTILILVGLYFFGRFLEIRSDNQFY